MKKSTQILILALIAVLAVSCATQQKLKTIREGQVQNVQLTLADDVSYLPEMKVENLQRDTLTIKDDDGTEILIMKAIKDEESGEMVATDVIEAAKVTARFRNVAERRGKIDLGFQIIVPESMIDSKWQLRFYPDMFIMEDSIRLEPVIITGEKYRNTQLKGYQQYERFLSKIISDTTIFVNVRALEIFIKRNIPEVYAFKTDSTIVSDEQFFSVYGVSEQEAVDHYTNKYAKNMNERRKARKDEMYRKYIKAPIVSEGLRLDSIITNPDGDFVYHYVQTIDTRPKLRKVDIVLSGEIYEQDVRLYTIPEVPPLTFYISSISAFADNTERYLTKVIERRASANTECKIAFELGKADIKLELADNLYEIQKIKTTLASLLNNETFDLDSILVSATASPEGSVATNRKLSNRRSESVSKYFNEFMSEYKDSLIIEGGVSMNMDGTEMEYTTKVQDIRFKIYEAHEDLDKRERVLSQEPYYRYLRDSLYPRLRTVKFNFFLHRKGMVKDTVHTTVLDSTYMNGVQALREMDYNTAVALLRPYNDYNTAVAYMGMDRNLSALQILEDMERTPQVNYLLAVLYSRTGDPQKAVQCYMNACNADRSYVYRGNLDPEISVLIKTYGLNQEPEEEYDF